MQHVNFFSQGHVESLDAHMARGAPWDTPSQPGVRTALALRRPDYKPFLELEIRTT